MVSFYRRFVPGCSTMGEPLFALCRGRTVFKWGPEQEQAFEGLTAALTRAPVLQFPQWDRLFYVETDASGVGLGAALTQDCGVEERLPVAYASRTLHSAERRYSATEREGLAVVWAVNHFKSYVMGMPFVVVTDHSALRALRTKEQLDGRLQRFAEKLSYYDYDIVYRPGKDNVVADLLSRALFYVSPAMAATMASEIKEAEQRNRIWLPKTSRYQVLRDLHCRWGGHLRFAKMWAAAKARYWWPSLRSMVDEVLKTCRPCAQFAMRRSVTRLRPIETQYPCELVVMDTGHVTLPSGRKEYFLVAVDSFTKWAEVRAVTSETGAAVAKFLREEIIERHGCPERLLTDNGSPYRGAAMQEECTRWGIHHHTSAPYHPETNGLAERTIGTLKRIMERLADGAGTKWKEHLGLAVMAYRLMPHSATGFSPFRMMYGREATTSTEIGRSHYVPNTSYGQAVKDHAKEMDSLFEQARSRAQAVREVRAAVQHAKMGTRGHPPYQVGDLVWYDQRRKERHRRRGLQRWIGPFRVAAVTPGPNYVLRGVGQATGEVLERVHPSFLKPFHGEKWQTKVRTG